MRVKICGLRRVVDAERCLGHGASHLGVVLAPDSPRCATLREARAIAAAAAGVADVVLVFRDGAFATVQLAAETIGVPRVQVHGASPGRLRRWRATGLIPLPVQRVTTDATALPHLVPAPSADAPGLFDGGSGGAGIAFPWRLLGDRAPAHVLIAGGVTPANVTQLVRHRPWGIDVGSGVESAPGEKDRARLRDLFAQLAAAAAVTP